MTKRCKRKLIFSSVTLTLSIIIIGIWIYFPVYIEKRALPGLCKKVGVELLSGHVQHFGLIEAEIRNLTLKIDGSRLISIKTVRLNYSLIALARYRIAVLTLSDLLLEVHCQKKQITVNDVLLPDKRSLYRALSLSNLDILKRKIPIRVERLVIRQSRAKINYDRFSWTVPFDMDLSKLDIKHGEISGFGGFNVNGDQIAFTLSLIHHFKKLDLSITGKQIQLAALAEDFRDFLPVQATGTADVQCNFSILPEVNLLQDTDLLVHLNNAHIKIADYVIANQNGESGKELPLEFHLTGSRPGPWELTATAVHFVSPLKVRIDGIKGTIMRTQRNYHIDAILRTQLEKLFPNEGPSGQKTHFDLAKPATLNWHITAKYSNKEGLHWSINQHRLTTDPALIIKGLLFSKPVRAELTAIGFDGHLSGKRLDAQSKIRLKHISLLIPDGNLECYDTNSDLRITLDFSDKALKMIGTSNTSINTVHLDGEGIKSSYRRLLLNCGIDHHKNESWILNTRASIGGTWVKISNDKRLRFGEVDIDLPFQLSKASSSPSGHVKIASMYWNTKHVGSLKGLLRQEESRVVLDGSHSNKILHGSPLLTIVGFMDTDSFQIRWYPPHRKSLGLLQPPLFNLKLGGIRLLGSFSKDYLFGEVEATSSQNDFLYEDTRPGKLHEYQGGDQQGR